MDPRFARPSSPGSRRIGQFGRSSTGTLIYPSNIDNYYPPPRTNRETIITNPRASAERITTRVVPRVVEAHQVRRAHDDYHVAPRRTTLDPMDPLPRIPNRHPPVLYGSVEPPASPASKSRQRDDGSYYIQPASTTSRRDHSRHYSVDNTDSLDRYMAGETRGATRSYVVNPASSTTRLIKAENIPRELPLYQKSGQIYNREVEPRGGHPRRREPLSGRRERPLSMGGIEDYAPSKVSSSSRESGPPVTTRGFDKLERASNRREEYRPRDPEALPSISSKDFARRSRDDSDNLNRRSSLREPPLPQDKDDGYTSYREDREPRRHHHHHRSRREENNVVDPRLEEDRREAEDRPKKRRDPISHRDRDEGSEREHRSRKERDEVEEREYRSLGERDDGGRREQRIRRARDEDEQRRSHKDRDEKPEKRNGSDIALGAAGAAAAGLVVEGIKHHRNQSRDERADVEVPVERTSERRRDREKERRRERDNGVAVSETSGNSGDSNEERREKDRRRERRREREREQEAPSRRHDDEREEHGDEHHRAISFDRGARPTREPISDEGPSKSRRSRKHRQRREDQSSEDEVSSEEERRAIEPAKPQVRVVSPEREPREPREPEVKPKGILRKPREKFPEEKVAVREGVAPLGGAGKKGVPVNARWTKISRSLVNPEALEQGNERYEEEGAQNVIVLRVLTKEEIQEYAELTRKLRLDREEKMKELRALEYEEGKYAREPLALENQPHEAENARLVLEGPSRESSPYVAEDRPREYHRERDRGDRNQERERLRDPVQAYDNPPYPSTNINPPYSAQEQAASFPSIPHDLYDPYRQADVPPYNAYPIAQPPQPQQPYPLPTHQQPDPYAQPQQIPHGPYVPQQNGAMPVQQGQMPYENQYQNGYQPPAGQF